jgi:C_GCAxxG_C_C family probable redox protein
MSKKSEQAAEFFSSGFNCCQSVFAPFAVEFGLDQAHALRLAQAFGGGMVSRGETCGAVTGSFMALGLKHGKSQAKDNDAKDKTYALVSDFHPAL